jgi:hypothetical protein
MGGEKLLAGWSICGRKARRRAEQDCRDRTQRIYKNSSYLREANCFVSHGLTLLANLFYCPTPKNAGAILL